MNTTGERIRELRIQNDLTLDDVAKHLGVGRQAIYKYEQGTVTNIPLENLEKMAALFGTTPGYLAGWSEEPPEPVQVTSRSITSRIISGGVERMPVEKQKEALKILQTIYADYFKEENNDDSEL